MSKLRVLAKKCAYTAYTAAANAVSLPHLFERKCRTSAAPQHGTLHWLLSLLIPTFYSRVCRTSVSTFPNLSQESRFPDSWELGDEFDHEDFDEWWYENDYYDDDRFESILRHSWEQEAVDEIIDEEQEDEYPRTDNTHGDW